MGGVAMLVSVGAERDWPGWLAVRLAALADAPEAFPRAIAEWTDGGERRWRERLLDASALKVMVLDAGIPMGLVRGVLEDGQAWLHSLWVSPQLRGRGLGDQLITAVEEWARPRAALVRLAVVADNAPAVALYRRHGYVDSSVPGGPLPNGARELVMEKDLGGPA